MTVKRYGAMHKDVWTDESGKYVRYEEYAALKSKMDMINSLMEAAEQASSLAKEEVDKLLKERDSLAVESAGINTRMQQLIQIINNADNSYCMCGEEMEKHTYADCGHPTGMFDYHYNKWLESSNETPANDAVIASIRADGAEMALEVMSGFTSDECGDSVYISVKELIAQLRKGPAHD